jgi:hypothetical protein
VPLSRGQCFLYPRIQGTLPPWQHDRGRALHQGHPPLHDHRESPLPHPHREQLWQRATYASHPLHSGPLTTDGGLAERRQGVGRTGYSSGTQRFFQPQVRHALQGMQPHCGHTMNPSPQPCFPQPRFHTAHPGPEDPRPWRSGAGTIHPMHTLGFPHFGMHNSHLSLHQHQAQPFHGNRQAKSLQSGMQAAAPTPALGTGPWRLPSHAERFRHTNPHHAHPMTRQDGGWSKETGYLCPSWSCE